MILCTTGVVQEGGTTPLSGGSMGEARSSAGQGRKYRPQRAGHHRPVQQGVSPGNRHRTEIQRYEVVSEGSGVTEVDRCCSGEKEIKVYSI